jgi:hypothetical protein
MPRDSNGNYSLPAGNPVTTLSVISSTWANTTLSDISTAMTGSLSRSGEGAMLAGLKLFDGVIGAPGLTWGTETTAGIYRNAAGDFRFAIGGADVFRFQTGGTVGLFANGAVGTPSISWSAEPTSGFYRNAAADFRYALGGVDFIQWTTNLESISGTAPARRWNETDAAANNRLWDVIASGEDLLFRTLTDALVATAWMSISRIAGVADAIIMHTPFRSQGLATFEAVGAASPSVNISSTRPILRWTETGVTANNSVWQIDAEGEAFRLFASDDAGGSSTIWMQVERTGISIDNINFPAGQLLYGSREVGYRQLLVNTKAANFSFTDAERGMIYRISAGTLTVTIDTTLTANSIFTLVNDGGGAATINGSGVTIQWFNGSGAVSSGSRTLAVAGAITVWMVNNTTAYVWGTGLS